MDKTEQMAEMVIQAAQVFIERRLKPLTDEVASLRAQLDAKGADWVKAEAGAAAMDACSKLMAAMPKPENGKSVDMDDVLPEIQRMVDAIPKPAPGKDADPSDVAAEVARQIALVPPPSDGKSVDLGAIFTEIGSAVTRAVDALPPPEPGKSITPEDVRPMIEQGIANAMVTIRQPKDGQSVTVEDVAPLLGQLVDKHMATIRRPEDGKSVTLEDVAPMIEDGIAKAVAAMPKPIDGKDADLGMVKDLVEIMVKSAMSEFRPPEKGEPGKDADPVDMDAVERLIADAAQRVLATWERPKDGKDGLGITDVSAELKEDGRTFVLKFSNETQEKTFEVECPWQIYRGLYEAGALYKKGDVVTYAGSQFTCKTETKAAPLTKGNADWVLSVKRGKDGKDTA